MNFIRTLWVCLVTWISKSTGDIEICSPGKTDVVYRISGADCPYGVLFKTPIDSSCMQTNDPDIDNYLADLCTAEPFSSNRRQLHVISSVDESDVPDTCAGEGPRKCNSTEIVAITAASLTPPILAGMESEVTTEQVLAPDELRNDSKVIKQTRRLFNYLIDLEYPTEEEREEFLRTGERKPDEESSPIPKSPYQVLKSPPRIIKLLELSFGVLHKFIDTRFVPRDFKNDVEHAFVYLVSESFQGSGVMEDIPVEDFEKIETSLQYCLSQPNPFTMEGKRCRLYQSIDWITKDDIKVYPKSDEFSFKPGVYDVATDAAWSALDFVHGLCYYTFSEQVNHHHMYERQVERLFNLQEIAYRWIRPPMLFDDRIWNKMLSTPSVVNTMNNLDAWTQAAYANTPFLHRLERPFLKYPKWSGASMDPDGPDSDFIVPAGNSTAAPPPAGGGGTAPQSSAPGGTPAAAPASDPGNGTAPAPAPDPGNGTAPASDPGAAPAPDPGAAPAPDPGAAPAPDPGAAPAPDPGAAPAPSRRRRKRQESDGEEVTNQVPTIQQRGLDGGGWCFQTVEEQRQVIMMYVMEKCADGPVGRDFAGSIPWLFTSKDETSSPKDEL